MEAVETHIGGKRGQPLGSAFNLRNAGEKGEAAAVLLVKGTHDRCRHFILYPRFGSSADVAQR